MATQQDGTMGRVPLIAAVVWLCLASAARAQSPAMTLGISYQALRAEATTLPTGGAVDVALRLRAGVALVASVDTTRGRDNPFGFPRTTRLIAVGGGLRVLPFRGWRLAPFGQVVVGAEATRLRVATFGTGSTTHVFWQPGGGLEVRLARSWSAFAEGDWRMVNRQLTADDGVRLSTGVRLTLR